MELSLRLQKERVKYNKNKPITAKSRVIMLVSVKNPKDIKLFYGLRPCIKFLKNNKGLTSSRETLLKYIKNEKEYCGYFCKFV